MAGLGGAGRGVGRRLDEVGVDDSGYEGRGVVGQPGECVGDDLEVTGDLCRRVGGRLVEELRSLLKTFGVEIAYVVVAGSSGTVKEISIFTTELATSDDNQIIVPNGRIWGAAITNYSVYATRRVDMDFGVSYSSDLKVANSVEKLILNWGPFAD